MCLPDSRLVSCPVASVVSFRFTAQNTEDAESMEMQICVCLSLAHVYTQILGSSKGCVLLFWPSASQLQSPRLNLNKVPGSGVTRTDPETWPRPTEHCALYSPARPSHSLPFPPSFSFTIIHLFITLRRKGSI